MELELANKVALVTAASRGLGYACASALAAHGARVAICSRHKDRIKGAASEIAEKTGGDVVGIQADLTVEEELYRLVNETGKILGPTDILVMSTGNPYPGCSSEVSDPRRTSFLVLRRISERNHYCV